MKKRILASLLAISILSSSYIYAQVGDIDYSQPISTCLNLTYNMGYKMSDANTGGQVTELQTFLISSGYMTGEATGYFGLATKRAVSAFQSERGLLANGYVGPYTRSVINRVSCNLNNNLNIGIINSNLEIRTSIPSIIYSGERVGNIDRNLQGIVFAVYENGRPVNADMYSLSVNGASLLPTIRTTRCENVDGSNLGPVYNLENRSCKLSNIQNEFILGFPTNLADNQIYKFGLEVISKNTNNKASNTYSFVYKKLAERCGVGFTWNGNVCVPNQLCLQHQYWNGLQCVNIIHNNVSAYVTPIYYYVAPNNHNNSIRPVVGNNWPNVYHSNSFDQNIHMSCPAGSQWDGVGCYKTIR